MKTKLLQLLFIVGLTSPLCCQKPLLPDSQKTSSASHIPYSYYLDNTCEWTFFRSSHYVDASSPTRSFVKYYLNGDTLIDGKWYYKLYEFRRDTTDSYVRTNTEFKYGLREDSFKRIYYHTGNRELLLWDFNIKVGDTIKIDRGNGLENTGCIVGKIDTVLVGNKPLKRFHCNKLGKITCGNMIIEGIGTNSDLHAYSLCDSPVKETKIKFSSVICYKRQSDMLLLDSKRSSICAEK